MHVIYVSYQQRESFLRPIRNAYTINCKYLFIHIISAHLSYVQASSVGGKRRREV